MARNLTEEEHRRVSAAIRRAEAETSGEIVCVLAQKSDGYFFPAAFFVTLAVLAASLAVAIASEWWWLSIRLPALAAAQLLAVGSALLLLAAFPALRLHLVPKRLAFLRAHDNAAKQFLARNMHLTAGRTGVLVFLSLEEHYAEIIADAGIAAHVPQEAWNEAVAALVAHARSDRLADGFCEAVAMAGRLLAAHFPRGADDGNELADRLIEI